MRHIKLWSRENDIVGLAIVDNDDYEELSRYRWHTDAYGYARRSLRRVDGLTRSITMHRQIMNTPKGMDTDHINRNILDNRKENLRICNRTVNVVNCKNRKDNTSGQRGVTFHKPYQRWVARISMDNKRVFLGSFKNKEDAIKAYLEADKERASKLFAA